MSQPDSGTPQRSSVFDHPLGFWFFFWGEFAERCCFYGMRAILLLYMIQILKFEDGAANRISSYFLAACYLLPLVGERLTQRIVRSRSIESDHLRREIELVRAGIGDGLLRVSVGIEDIEDLLEDFDQALGSSD